MVLRNNAGRLGQFLNMWFLGQFLTMCFRNSLLGGSFLMVRRDTAGRLGR